MLTTFSELFKLFNQLKNKHLRKLLYLYSQKDSVDLSE
jgi:hypothetical protein